VPTTTTKMTVHVEGLTETVRAFNRYGKAANNELRDAAQGEVNKVAPMLVAAMRSDGGPSALVASSVSAKRDRYPVIKAAGSKRVATRKRGRGARPRAGDLFFGAEFGGRGRSTTQQFRPWKGTTGYAFYPTLRRHTSDIVDGYRKALNDLARKWGRGGSE
jgi:hypothetical protein